MQISVENSKKNPESYSQNRACNIAHNGKSIGEGRATLQTISKEDRT